MDQEEREMKNKEGMRQAEQERKEADKTKEKGHCHVSEQQQEKGVDNKKKKKEERSGSQRKKV